jgi:deoxyadenosine kinase
MSLSSTLVDYAELQTPAPSSTGDATPPEIKIQRGVSAPDVIVHTDKAPVKESYTDAFGGQQLTIGVSALIGAGKSTFTSQLAKHLGIQEIQEPVIENPYLPEFYAAITEFLAAKSDEDTKRFAIAQKRMHHVAFAMQVFLLNERFRQHQSMVWSSGSSVQDRTIYEDPIFAKMLYESGMMAELDYTTYKGLFRNMMNFLHRPDVILILDVDPEVAKQRVIARGRECEKDLSVEYLRDLKAGYEDWISDINGRIPIIRIDWNTFQTPEAIVKLIQSKLRKSLFAF